MGGTYHVPHGQLADTLARLVSYGCKVESIERARDGGWTVETVKAVKNIAYDSPVMWPE